jgi:hypothetical protein
MLLRLDLNHVSTEETMKHLHKLALLSVLTATCLGHAGLGQAQSTDGFHSIQVFPVVADTASFTQKFTLHNPNAQSITITPRYFPGDGTPQATPGALTCPNITIAANSDSVFNTLRLICPALAAGSNFGFLHLTETTAVNGGFSGYSRVSNPAGNGFSVEAFPAHTFTSADTRVSGIRRLAATVGAPAFQTNCFLANLNDLTPAATPVSTTITYIIKNSLQQNMASGTVNLVPGRLVRLLDVFATAGIPGDVDNASITFTETSADEPALMAYCTVQDNTSFGADFRIAKQVNSSSASGGLYAQDDHVNRDILEGADIFNRAYTIPAGSQSANTHLMYFRHPDNVQCEIIDPATGVRATQAYGLEMRLVDQNNNPIPGAGGDNATGFGEVYLGDKTDRNGGANTRYTIEVESNTTNTAANKPYLLRCQSGSGHTMGDVVRYQEAIDRF